MPIKTLIETDNNTVNGNALFFGTQLPENKVALCYYETLQMEPDDCVNIMSSWDDIPGNEDDAINGTRQIKINSAIRMPSGKWSISVTPGSFYFTEVLRITGNAADRLERDNDSYVKLLDVTGKEFPTWETFTETNIPLDHEHEFPNEVVLRWEYSLGRKQASVNRHNFTATTKSSNPVMIVGDDDTASTFGLLLEAPEQIGKTTYKVKNTPILYDPNDIKTFPRIVMYANGVLVNTDTFSTDTNSEFRFAVVDANNGIIESARDLSSYEIYVQYIAVVEDYILNETYDNTTAICPVNLNPQLGQTAVSNVSVAIESTYSKLSTDGVQIFMQPLRCVVLDRNGVELVTFENNRYDQLRWCYDGEVVSAAFDIYTKKLASIYVRPATALGSTRLYDIRTRGGGIIEGEDINSYPDHIKFFDIEGIHMDGDVSMENGVVIVKIATALYNEHGEAKIREAIEKSITGGIAYLIKLT